MSAILFTFPCGLGLNMKLRFRNFYVRLGSTPTQANNFISTERRGSNVLIRVAACAEEFYRALAFYMDVSAEMRSLTESCWFELQRRRRRLPSEIANGINMVGYTPNGALYGSIGADEIRTLIDEFWQSDRFRMIGTSRIPATSAVGLVASFDKSLGDTADLLPKSVMFILERQYLNDEPFLTFLITDQILNSARELLGRAAARLQHGLLEVGPEAWPL